MFEVEMLIPVADNDGNLFDRAHDEKFEAHVLASFGGFQWRGTVKGGWLDSDKIYVELTREFVIAVVSIGEGAKVRDIALFANRQEAIYLRFLGVTEIIR